MFRYQKVVLDFTFIKHSIIFCLMVPFYSYHFHCHQTLPIREYCIKIQGQSGKTSENKFVKHSFYTLSYHTLQSK